jgi:hypothetical protein
MLHPTHEPPTTTLRIEDVQAAFRWIRRELVTNGCAEDEQAAGTLEARLDDIELDVVGYLTDRARITRAVEERGGTNAPGDDLCIEQQIGGPGRARCRAAGAELAGAGAGAALRH